jgi:flavin reductase (DIM6/NTAB) family NADH-FMN oxidoreductase RutF
VAVFRKAQPHREIDILISWHQEHNMHNRPNQPPTAPFDPRFFPLHIALLTVGENLMPIGYWTVISKNPFRFLISMGVGNHSLTLLKKYKEAALHFMPWETRETVIRAGYLSGRSLNKAEKLGFELQPAHALKHTRILLEADSIFETRVYMELMNLSREFAPFVLEVVHVHHSKAAIDHQPILFYGEEDFATVGARWQYQKVD